VYTGYVDRADLPALYSMASLFAFPSLYEGFGLPVLEAMACGVPVLISRAGALPEIAGNIGPRVDPESVPAIAEGMLQLLTDEQLRRTNIRYGLDRVRSFTWEDTAWQTLEVYNSLLQ
jgi:glycosyltransferase involved in cell wall biosynthesis